VGSSGWLSQDRFLPIGLGTQLEPQSRCKPFPASSLSRSPRRQDDTPPPSLELGSENWLSKATGADFYTAFAILVMKNRTVRTLSRAIGGIPSLCSRARYSTLVASPRRRYSTHPPNARLNLPIDYSTTPLLAHSAQIALGNPELPPEVREGTTKKLNLFQAVNDALSIALAEDESVLVFGEDIAFGGVFRCTAQLQDKYGGDRVFNTPLVEQGIVGFAIGIAAEGMRPVAEIQFADYVYPAFDQLVNEAAKFRYRDGSGGRSAGGMTVRMPCGGIGHGALYHSQSPESLFTHIPGLKVIMPRSPIQAKGLLLAAIRSNDPCLFMEPKILYRAAVEQVPTAAYELPLSKAEVLKEGKDVTIVSYGAPLYKCMAAIQQIEAETGISGELIDLRTIYPWDKDTVLESVRKTGRCIVVHEAMVNAGVGAEVAAAIQEDEDTFCALKAPVMRVAGWSIHTPLVYEAFHLPDVASKFCHRYLMIFVRVGQLTRGLGIYDSIKQIVKF